MIHLILYHGRPGQVKAKLTYPNGVFFSDMQLGLPGKAIPIHAGEEGTKLKLVLMDNKGKHENEFTVYIHTQAADASRDSFLPGTPGSGMRMRRLDGVEDGSETQSANYGYGDENFSEALVQEMMQYGARLDEGTSSVGEASAFEETVFA